MQRPINRQPLLSTACKGAAPLQLAKQRRVSLAEFLKRKASFTELKEAFRRCCRSLEWLVQIALRDRALEPLKRVV
jgi:hypothetical protein